MRTDEEQIQEIYSRRKTNVKPNTYSYLNPANLFAIHSRERQTLAMLTRAGITGLPNLKVLDVGCGWGFNLRQFINWGAEPFNLTGVDLLPERVAGAQKKMPPGVEIRCASATELPFGRGEFDLVMQSTVFSSMPEVAIREAAAREMLRVLKPGGAVLWYDLLLDNPKNPDVHGIPAKEIRRLFPNCRVELEQVTLAPPIARRLAARARPLCSLLAGLRVLNVCYLGLISPSR